jgi:hypothetical protein
VAKRLWPAVLVLCLTAMGAAQTRRVDSDSQPVRLVQIGVRSTNGVHSPLWAVMMGDTTAAEQYARRFKSLGPYALNATVWTHQETSPDWMRTTFVRPRDIDEAVDLHNDSRAFTFRKSGDVLPREFKALAPSMMERVDFIIRYEDDGSAKAYLYPYTSRDEADQIVRALSGGD